MKPTRKKRAAKKRNPMVGKLLDLKYRINEAYRSSDSSGKSESTKNDKSWVMNQISDLRDGAKLGKENMMRANDLWRKYS